MNSPMGQGVQELNAKVHESGDADSPVFIVGVPRSGTTVMRSLVSAHPKIAIAPETHFVNTFVAGKDEPVGEDDFERFWSWFAGSGRFRSLGLEETGVKNAIIESGDFTYRSIFATLLREYSIRHGKARFGEKTPDHYPYVSVLLDWFPTARVLYMMRDPRAVCASMMSVWWRSWDRKGLRMLEPRAMTRLRRVYHDSIVWQWQVEMFRNSWRDDPRVRRVCYEKLVEHPEETLREVCEFLDEPFDLRMMEPRRRQNLIAPAALSVEADREEWRRAHMAKAREPIFTDSLRKWRAELSVTEIDTIESVCAPGMRWLGYPMIGEGRRVGVSSTIKSKLARAWCRAYWRRGADGPQSRWSWSKAAR